MTNRVTPQDIEDNIVTEEYFTPNHAARETIARPDITKRELAIVRSNLGVLTICVLTLRNGFTVMGQSACANVDNFDPELGKKIARANAVEQIWPLMGYELKSKIHLAQEASIASHPEASTYVGTKVIHAFPMTLGAYNELRGWELPADEDGSVEGYLVEYPDQESNIDGYRGYVSWSPRDVFEEIYKQVTGTSNSYSEVSDEPEDFITRLKFEKKELSDKLSKLIRFLASPSYKNIDPHEQENLQHQYHAMRTYNDILNIRINYHLGK